MIGGSAVTGRPQFATSVCTGFRIEAPKRRATNIQNWKNKISSAIRMSLAGISGLLDRSHLLLEVAAAEVYLVHHVRANLAQSWGLPLEQG